MAGWPRVVRLRTAEESFIAKPSGSTRDGTRSFPKRPWSRPPSPPKDPPCGNQQAGRGADTSPASPGCRGEAWERSKGLVTGTEQGHQPTLAGSLRTCEPRPSGGRVCL